jgi:hypothetical protein
MNEYTLEYVMLEPGVLFSAMRGENHMLMSAIPRTSSLPFWACRANEPAAMPLALGLPNIGRTDAHPWIQLLDKG